VEQQYRRQIDRLMVKHGAGAVLVRMLRETVPEESLGEVELPRGAGWNTFVEVGKETARQLVTGVLSEAGSSDPQFRTITSPAALQGYLRQAHQAGELTRHRIVLVARSLCARHRTEGEWLAFLRSPDGAEPAAGGP
jgi:hypothetical protein